MTLRRRLLSALFFAVAFVSMPLATLWAAVTGGVKGLAFSIKSGADTVVRVRAERVFQDSQTRGFFKIGILPCWVAEGVEIQCRDAAHLKDVLGSARGALMSGSTERALEFRRLALSMPDDVSPKLRASRVRFKGPNAWELMDGVCWQSSAGAATKSDTAFLIVSGPEAGWLSAQVGTNQVRVNLFSQSQPQTVPTESFPP